jgi:hypothetical protein
MFRNGRGIAETVDERQTSVSSHGSGSNGDYRASGVLSWYFAQRATKGRTYLLTANGYVTVPPGFPPSQKGFDEDELIG